MNFNESRDYVCPVCGRDFSSENAYPGCDFCNNHELVVYPGGEWKEIRAEVSKMSPLEFQENLKLEPWDKFYIELYAGDKEKIKRQKNTQYVKSFSIKNTSTTAPSLTKPSLTCVPSGNMKTP